ncbi:hypothetical protein AWM70_00890 [Paenibacillus yonginensis]|uniref:PucR family transcriptional regulator n=1 Tax=Paenibacillus yonginensis TaxID=1462996 RepID=A0A1B1MVZ9_9BACL|nr:PucR family transcriptional regulator [Paenibacillus yonginensis]ANS73317.1 hypothetical protein AWM70_00890 [Paenibacillus yonginensis]
MYMTVEEALSIYPLSEGNLVAGKTGLRRIVKSVNVMDAPDIADWVHEGEVLFTTAYLIKDHPEEGAALVGKLARKGAAALGIKLGRFWTEIPETILQEADRIGFPIIELPYPFTFSDQMNGLFRAELNQTTLALKHLVEKQQALLRFALGGKKLNFFEELASILDCPMAVIRSDKRVLFSSMAAEESELLKTWPWKPHPHTRRSETGQRLLLFPLADKHQQWNGFAVFQRQADGATKEEERLLAQAAEWIAYHLEELEVSRKDHDDHQLAWLVQCYLNRDISIEAVLGYARDMQTNLMEEPFLCLWTTPLPSMTDPASVRSVLRGIRQEFQYHPSLKGMAQLQVEMEEGLLSIVPCQNVSEVQRLASLLPQLFSSQADEQAGKPAGSYCYFYISNLKHKPVQLAEAYQECLSAADTARRLNLNRRVVDYRSIEFADLFTGLPVNKMRQFSARLLAPIWERPPEAAEEMLTTLRLYLHHNGQTAEAAKDMFVHRNTVAYRLEKIGELLGLDLRNYEHLLKLKLALLFEDFLEREPVS